MTDEVHNRVIEFNNTYNITAGMYDSDIFINKCVYNFINSLINNNIEILDFENEYGTTDISFNYRGRSIRLTLRSHRNTIYFTMQDLETQQDYENCLLFDFNNCHLDDFRVFNYVPLEFEIEYNTQMIKVVDNGQSHRIKSKNIISRFLDKLANNTIFFDYITSLFNNPYNSYNLDYVKDRLLIRQIKEESFILDESIVADDRLINRVNKYLDKTSTSNKDILYNLTKYCSISFELETGTLTSGRYYYEFKIKNIKYKKYLKYTIFNKPSIVVQIVSNEPNDFKRAYSLLMPENHSKLLKYLKSKILKLDNLNNKIQYTTQTYKKIPSELSINN